MTLEEIRAMPLDAAAFAIHESIFRSYHIVDKVVELLKEDCPAKVVLEIIEDLRNAKWVKPTDNGLAAIREALS